MADIDHSASARVSDDIAPEMTVRLDGRTAAQAQRLASSRGETLAEYVTRLIWRDAEHVAELHLLAEEQERAQDA